MKNTPISRAIVAAGALATRFRVGIRGIARDLRWSYLPPLMVYFAAGVSGFTGIIEAFFVKDKLGLTPACSRASASGRACPGR